MAIGMCARYAGTGGGYYYQASQRFAADTYVTTVTYYDDPGCTEPHSSLPHVSTIGGTYHISNKGVLTDNLEAVAIDLRIEELYIDNVEYYVDDSSSNIYSILLIDDDSLYLGADAGVYDGSAPELRHQQLDYEHVFTRN